MHSTDTREALIMHSYSNGPATARAGDRLDIAGILGYHARRMEYVFQRLGNKGY
jgi:hypothetical protein